MEPELASELFDSLGLEALLPETLAAWRPLLAEGMALFLDRLGRGVRWHRGDAAVAMSACHGGQETRRSRLGLHTSRT